jgi:hypothetical protein
MINLFQILNQFVLLFRKNVIEKGSMIWRVLPLVKIITRISETPCIILLRVEMRKDFFVASPEIEGRNSVEGDN